jgi:hypothetical protein
MCVARPHTRPHTNRRNRRYSVELQRSPRLRIAGSNPAVESPKWRRSAVLDRTRTARCPFGPHTAACTDARRWSVDAPRECSFGWIGTVTASLLPWSTDAGARLAAIARRRTLAGRPYPASDARRAGRSQPRAKEQRAQASRASPPAASFAGYRQGGRCWCVLTRRGRDQRGCPCLAQVTWRGFGGRGWQYRSDPMVPVPDRVADRGGEEERYEPCPDGQQRPRPRGRRGATSVTGG